MTNITDPHKYVSLHHDHIDTVWLISADVGTGLVCEKRGRCRGELSWGRKIFRPRRRHSDGTDKKLPVAHLADFVGKHRMCQRRLARRCFLINK